MVRYRRLLLITAVVLLVTVGAMLPYQDHEPGCRGVVMKWSQALQQPGSHRIVTLPGDRFALDQDGAYGTNNVEQGPYDPATGRSSFHLVRVDLPR